MSCNFEPKRQFTFKWQLKFIAMIVFTAILFLIKVVIGQVFNSMALIADSFHMITDFAALTVGYIALRLANNKTESGKLPSEKFTFGWIRAEVLGGLINTVLLFALCFSVFVASLKRFVEPETMDHPEPVLIVGIISLVVNFLGLFLFRASRDNICQCCFRKSKNAQDKDGVMLLKKEKERESGKSLLRKISMQERMANLTWHGECETPHSLNIRGVYLHILEHFFTSMIVIVSALIVKYVRQSWTQYIDPGFTVLVVLMILYSTVPLFRETIILFMQSVPANLKVKDMEERLVRRIPAVLSVHEFHIWQLAGDQVVASAHILFRSLDDYKIHEDDVKSFFQNEGIGCMTFQPEFAPKEQLDEFDSPVLIKTHNQCFYSCTDDHCKPFTCCGADQNPNSCENHELIEPPTRDSVVYESAI